MFVSASWNVDGSLYPGEFARSLEVNVCAGDGPYAPAGIWPCCWPGWLPAGAEPPSVLALPISCICCEISMGVAVPTAVVSEGGFAK